MEIGLKLKNLRKFCKLTQYEFAKLLDISPSTVASWEVGRRNPKPTQIIKVAIAVNCPLENIIDFIIENCRMKSKK